MMESISEYSFWNYLEIPKLKEILDKLVEKNEKKGTWSQEDRMYRDK